jgi:hypothetical protein
LSQSKKNEIKKIDFKEGLVSAQSVDAIRKGIVSGSNVQQAKSQIPKPKDQ